jgi:hypothetical protein
MMIRKPLNKRQTVDYDDQIDAMDEKICALIKQRIHYTQNNNLLPPLKKITEWAKTYELPAEMLMTLFSDLEVERYKPPVKPNEFRKNIPVLKSVEINNYIYTVIFLRQYGNASVVHVTINWAPTTQQSNPPLLELYMGEEYRCEALGGGGTSGHIAHDFIISPALPDELSGMKFYFYHQMEKEEQEIRTEFVISID